MKKTVHQALLLALFLCAVALHRSQAVPGWGQVVPTEDNSGVSIEVSSAFSQAPASGFMPFRVTVNNRSGAARTYQVNLSSKGTYPMNGSTMSTGLTFTAENDRQTRHDVLLPVLPTTRGGAYYLPVTIQVNGYGVASPQVFMSSNYRTSSGDRTAFVALSERLHTRSWGVLEKQVAADGSSLYGSSVDLTLLPPDWRALVGVQGLWIAPEDFAELDAAHRTALKDWVGRGGRLYVCENTPDQPTRAEFGLSQPEKRSVDHGFGQVNWFSYEGEKELPVGVVAKDIYQLRAQEDNQRQDAEDWPMAKGAGKLKLNTPFLLGFVGLFAILVGPFNLFYLARADRRHRLFWTTPAISVGASLLLIGVIVLQDGFGGNGTRVALTYLLPDGNKAVTIQEQVTRTGVLFGRGFNVNDDLFLSPVNFRVTNNRQFAQEGRQYGGDWFASRSLQAQRIESIQPTRARVQLLNAEEVKNGGAPKVVSSLPVELESFLFRDGQERYWVGKNLRTGEAQVLSSLLGASQLLQDMLKNKGSNHLNDFEKSGPRAGNFAAKAARGNGPFIDTLRSIRWHDDQAFYMGPATTER